MQNIIKTAAFTLVFSLCQYFGIAQTNTPAAKDSSLNQPLPQKDLQGVTVSSAKPFIVVTAEKITLNVAQSPISAGSNAYELVKKAPGVAERSAELSYKGKSTKILINGRPANLSGEELKALLSSMPGSSVEKIELLPNPSAKYDAQGGSVINIQLMKNKGYGTNYTLNTGLGAGKYIKGNTGLDVNYRAKDINIFGSYNFIHSKQYSSLNSTRYLPGGTINASQYDENDRNSNGLRLGLDYDLTKKSSIGFLVNGFLNYRDRSVDNASRLHYNNNPADSMSKVLTNGKASTGGALANIYYKAKFDSTGKELTLNVDYMNYNKRWNDRFTNNYYDSKGNEYLQPLYIKNNAPVNIGVYALTADYVQPGKKGNWEAGIKSSYTVTNSNVDWQNSTGNGWATDTGKTNHFIYKEWVNAAYLNYSTTIKKWEIQTGLRAELTHTTGRSVTLAQTNKNNRLDLFPNIAVQFNQNENNQLGFSYRKSILRYGFSYVNPFITYQNQYAYSQGNPNIQPELSHSFELSYTYKQAYSVSVNYSHGRHSLGEIYLQGANNATISSYGNYNSNDVAYISLSAYQPITKYWTTSINPMAGFMTLNNSSAVSTNTSSKKMLITQINWSNDFSFKKGWGAEFSLMYLSPFQYGSYKTKTLFSADLGVSKKLFKEKASLRLSVPDIFNTLAYNKEVNYAGVMTAINQKDESRFINLAFRYKFGNLNVKAKAQRASKVGDIQNRIK